MCTWFGACETMNFIIMAVNQNSKDLRNGSKCKSFWPKAANV